MKSIMSFWQHRSRSSYFFHSRHQLYRREAEGALWFVAAGVLRALLDHEEEGGEEEEQGEGEQGEGEEEVEKNKEKKKQDTRIFRNVV